MKEEKTVRLYSPETIAAYTCLCSLPLGALLFGINASRRGYVTMGRCIVASALLLLVGISTANIVGLEWPNLMLFNIIIALGLWEFETPLFSKDLAAGARAARWWPPILIFLVASVVVLVISLLVYP